MLTLHPAINRSYIAKRLGVSRSFVSQVENGIRPMPERLKLKLEEVKREIREHLQISAK